ncbi:alpha/beta fold hydrolase [Cupriavidus campinensis]|uniref:alpha/beta fold hydrolase n=1 Tax=Cupriavidus campinensis TaxID=151783 RepID=UPI0011EF03F6|nr:alpha/beta hydrolase [Cupriavidus campinensis]
MCTGGDVTDDDVIAVGGGPITVVAVHGIQGTRAAWLPLARELADRCTFILPNLPGRGLAKAPASEDDCTLDAYARALGRTITRHVDGPFVLAGWSMGVSVALAYLSQARTTAAWPSPAELLLVSGTPYLDAVAWFPPSSPDALLEAIATREQRLGLREAADHRTVAWTWNAIRRTDQRGELAHITTPARVIHGSEDADCPLTHGAMLADGVPRAEFHVLQGAGHSVLTERTEDIAAYLRKQWFAPAAAPGTRTYPRETA